MAVSQRLRFQILHRDGFRCRYCGATAADEPLVVDHVVPVALGGSDHPTNLVTACVPCNAGKSDMPLWADPVDDVIDPVLNPKLPREFLDLFPSVGQEATADGT